MIALALAAGSPAVAGTVDYTTTATFACAPGTCAITGNGTGTVTVVYGSGINTATLLFTGTPAGTSVDSDDLFSSAGYGTIRATYTGRGSQINGTLELDVLQTRPDLAPTIGAFPTATLSGLVYDGKSTSYADFGVSDPSISLGGPITYELDTSTNIRNYSQFGYTIVSPSTGTAAGRGVTSFQGNVLATPEPTFMTLTGAGFAGLAAIAVTRRRPAQQA